MRVSHITLAVAMIAMGSATAQMHDNSGNAIVRRGYPYNDSYGETSLDDSTGSYEMPEAKSSSSTYPYPTGSPHEKSPEEHEDYPAEHDDTSDEHDLKGEPMTSSYSTPYTYEDAEAKPSTSCSSSSADYPEATPVYGATEDTPDYKDTPDEHDHKGEPMASPYPASSYRDEYTEGKPSTSCSSSSTEYPEATPVYGNTENSPEHKDNPDYTDTLEDSPEYESTTSTTSCKPKPTNAPEETPDYSTTEDSPAPEYTPEGYTTTVITTDYVTVCPTGWSPPINKYISPY